MPEFKLSRRKLLGSAALAGLAPAISFPSFARSFSPSIFSSKKKDDGEVDWLLFVELGVAPERGKDLDVIIKGCLNRRDGQDAPSSA